MRAGSTTMLPGSIAGGIRGKKRPAGTLAGPMVMLTARARWLFDFHARMSGPECVLSVRHRKN